MANPPYGDSSKDPTMPTYATGTTSLMSTDKLDDCAKAPTGTSMCVSTLRAWGVGNSNADWNNDGLSGNVVPKAFPGLQS